MPRMITVAAVQAAPIPPDGLPVFGRDDAVAQFAADVRRLRAGIAGPALIVYPEIHLFGTDDPAMLRSAAEPLDGALVAELAGIAREADAWLIPGSLCELGPTGEFFNTATVFAPDGTLAGAYRKIFPWRPFELFTPGDQFVTVDIPDIGRLGLSICYDAWFPEVSRHLAWMGAEVIVNIVKTTTPDRDQEMVLARANSIVNQVFTVSVNCGGPVGMGRSVIVDPEGRVLQETQGAEPETLYRVLDFDDVTRVREHGTAGTNRMWSQFTSADAVIPLPMYDGRIDPLHWSPAHHHADLALRAK